MTRTIQHRRTATVMAVTAVALLWLGTLSVYGLPLTVTATVLAGRAAGRLRHERFPDAVRYLRFQVAVTGLVIIQQLPWYARGQATITLLLLLIALTLAWHATRRAQRAHGTARGLLGGDATVR